MSSSSISSLYNASFTAEEKDIFSLPSTAKFIYKNTKYKYIRGVRAAHIDQGRLWRFTARVLQRTDKKNNSPALQLYLYHFKTCIRKTWKKIFVGIQKL